MTGGASPVCAGWRDPQGEREHKGEVETEGGREDALGMSL